MRNSSTFNVPIDETYTRLYYYHELDEWQQDNHFIKSAYVKETNSYLDCFKSLTYLHNETVNIYSHLVPAIFGAIFVMYFVNWKLNEYDNYLGFWERANFLMFGGAASFCMFLSALFHSLKSHSLKVCKFGNQCDYFGIIILITCSLISIMLFAFHDVPYWRNGFIGLFLLLGGICSKVTFDKKFSTPLYRPFRSMMFILFGLSGALPVIAAVKLFGYHDAVERSNAAWLVLEGIFYITGACLYAMRLPERLTHKEEHLDILNKPIIGRFDVFGNSHQIFHVMVVIAAYCHWRALEGCYHYLHVRVLNK